jgi:hypothetical protein
VPSVPKDCAFVRVCALRGGEGMCRSRWEEGVGFGQWGIIASTLVRVCGIESRCLAWIVVSLRRLRVVLMCFQLVQLSCMVSGDLALWGVIWRRPVPSSRAGGDGWCCMRAVGCLGASFVWVGTGEPFMLAYMHQS